jgi:hypothetical protein
MKLKGREVALLGGHHDEGGTSSVCREKGREASMLPVPAPLLQCSAKQGSLFQQAGPVFGTGNHKLVALDGSLIDRQTCEHRSARRKARRERNRERGRVVVDDLKDFWKWLDLTAAGLPSQGKANTEQATRTGIKRQDLSGPEEVVYGGRRGRVIRYIHDPFGALDLLELGFGDSKVRLHGYFGEDDEFMEVDRKRIG